MRIILIILFALTGFVLAQPADLPDPSWDPTSWFGSAAALAAVVAAAVAFVKRNVVELHDWMTVAASFVLAIVVSVVGSMTSAFDASLIEAVSFGASAALLASGGWDVVSGLLGKD